MISLLRRKQEEQHCLKVALLSLSHRSRAMLQFFFLSIGRSTFEEAPEDAADAVIFDYDNPESREHWEAHREKHGRFGILLSVTQQQIENTVWVQKPFSQAALLSAARDILARREVLGGVETAIAVETRVPQSPSDRAVASARVANLEPRIRSHPNPFDRFLESQAAPQHVEGDSARPAAQAVQDDVTRGPSKLATNDASAAAPAAEGASTSKLANTQMESASAALEAEPRISDRARPEIATDDATEEMSRFCGDREDVSPSALTSRLEEIYFPPESYLIGVVKEAHRTATKWHVPTEIRVEDKRIVFVPGENRVYVNFRSEALSELCAEPLSKRCKSHTFSTEELDQIAESIAQLTPIDRMESFVWKVSLECSRGRLPKGTQVDRVVYLKDWPNLTRLLLTPHALRLAALWATRGASLLETIGRVHIPQRHIFAFYNAVSALGLVTDDGSHLKRIGKRKEPKNRKLLGRLLGWLRGLS